MFSYPVDQLLIKKLKIITKDGIELTFDNIEYIGSNSIDKLIELLKSNNIEINLKKDK